MRCDVVWLGKQFLTHHSNVLLVIQEYNRDLGCGFSQDFRTLDVCDHYPMPSR